jgi:hypothetical protein
MIAPSNFHAPWSGFSFLERMKLANGCGSGNVIDDKFAWEQFHKFLQHMTSKTAGYRLRYTKQFCSVLQNGDAQSLLLEPLCQSQTCHLLLLLP